MSELTNKTPGTVLASIVEVLTSDECLNCVCPPDYQQSPIPSQHNVEAIIGLCRAVIFPGFYGEWTLNSDNLSYSVGLNVERLNRLLETEIAAVILMAEGRECVEAPAVRLRAADIALKFIESLPKLREALNEDVEATYNGDPAALSQGEVILCYPGIRAIVNHRVAHRLHELGVPVLPRMIAERAHRETGIDIHPAATIGRAFMIDHGTGVVIGETAVIGDRVKIYQGVTLGARSFPTDENNNAVKGLPRHPIIGDDVVIYANSTILGRITIGSNSTVGGNLWVTRDLPPYSIALQANLENSIRTKIQQS